MLKNNCYYFNMVHGTCYGIQYEIYLNKKLDLFNDVLPICIDVRKMISLERIHKDSNQYKLVVIPYIELDNRFKKREYTRRYIQSLDQISFNHHITRKSNPEAFKYYDVKIYDNIIKYNEYSQPFTQEELKNCEKKFEDVIEIYEDDNFLNKPEEERKEIDFQQNNLRRILNIQRIISNPVYFEEIKQIQHELTDIKLTEEEEGLVLQVLYHPLLEGIISSHGINLINHIY